MWRRCLRIAFPAILGFPGWALAAPLDPKGDESYLQLQFERSQARALETVSLRDAKRKEFLDRSRVGGAGDSCLAYAIATGSCSISAAAFDRGLASQFPDSLEFQSAESLAWKARKARRVVFEQLLDRAFLEGYRREDSLRFPVSGNRKIPVDARERFAGFDFPTLLMAFPRVRAQVYAASDSAWLATRLENVRSGMLPITMPAWELPDSAAKLLAHYPPGEWTPILRVPFGFIACGWLDTLPAPGVLAEIRSRLDQPGTKSGIQSRPQAMEAMRKPGESKPGEMCLDEDTLGLALRLSPPLRRQAQEPVPAWLTASSAVLPASLKRRLWAQSKRGATDTLGPIRGDYGIWMLALSSPDIKPGRSLDSLACMARADEMRRKAENAGRIRLEWEAITSKAGFDRSGDARTALFELLSRQGGDPDSSYRRMRERWVSGSLRFTRDMDFLYASPEPGTGKTE